MSVNKKISINTLIISDTHLGEGDVRSQEILDVLKKYKFERLILNGDIVDGLHFQRFHSRHWQVLSKFRELSKTCEVVWVHGNHDASSDILSRLLGVKVCNRYIWEDGRKKFLVIHGHQFDRFMHNNFILSYVAFSSYMFLKQFNKIKFATELIRNKSNTWKRNSLGVASGALRFGKMLGVDCVFCGHTHQIYTTKNWGVEYYNTGAWVESTSAYVVVHDGKVKLETV